MKAIFTSICLCFMVSMALAQITIPQKIVEYEVITQKKKIKAATGKWVKFFSKKLSCYPSRPPEDCYGMTWKELTPAEYQIVVKEIRAVSPPKTGMLKARIMDFEIDEGIAFVTVTLTNEKGIYGGQTDLEGNCKVKDIPVGTYQMEVRFIGYQSAIVKEVVIRKNKYTEFELSLMEDNELLNAVVITSSCHPDRSRIHKVAPKKEAKVSPMPITRANIYQLQNFPNPFVEQTSLSYHLPEAAKVQLQIHDVTGRLIVTLVDEQQTVGNYSVDFRPPVSLSTNTLFYTLKVGEQTTTRKMLLRK